MINTDGKPTIANAPTRLGREFRTTPQSEEVKVETSRRTIADMIQERERTTAADNAAVKDDVQSDFGGLVHCYTVVGLRNGRDRVSFEVEASDPVAAELAFGRGYPKAIIAAVIDDENGRVIA